MVAMKKTVLPLTLLALTTASMAFAQIQPGEVTCEVSEGNTRIRAEGMAEMVGDIFLECTTTQGADVVGVDDEDDGVLITNISVTFPDYNVTNNINFDEDNLPSSGELTDAVLIIENQHCEQPQVESSRYSTYCDDEYEFSQANPAEFAWPQYGVLATELSQRRVVWTGIRLPVPAAQYCSTFIDNEGWECYQTDFHPEVINLRITGLRVNATEFDPDVNVTVRADVNIENSDGATIDGDSTLDVADPRATLDSSVDLGSTDLRCDPDASEEVQAGVWIEEKGFASAFRPLGYPAFNIQNSESEMGYFSPGSNGRSGDTNTDGPGDLEWNELGGGASQGTQFVVSFVNIPDGTTLYVPEVIENEDGTLMLQLADEVDYDAGTPSTDGACPLPYDDQDCSSAMEEVDFSNGAGQVVYEVVASSGVSREEIGIPLSFEVDGGAITDGSSTVGQASVGYAPQSDVNVADEDEPEPRFGEDSNSEFEDVISVAGRICGTTLLFPFVTAQAGFDTGIAISNTSEDWIGTEPQDGACTIHYIGEGEGGSDPDPMEETSDVIDGGDQLIFTLSSGNAARNVVGNAGFQGFLIAQCEFQYAHGFAFITDGFGGIPALAQGYLALVIPLTETDEGDSIRIPGVPNLHNLGETLFH